MKKIIILALSMMILPAQALETCTKTVTGTTYCSGSDEAGVQIRTESVKTATGTTFITGSQGDQQVKKECYTTVTGTTYCK